jgi:hypothetical protein
VNKRSVASHDGVSPARAATSNDIDGLVRIRAEPDDSGLIPYEIGYSLPQGYLELRLVGLWDEATFAIFADLYAGTVARFADRGGVSHQLVDGRDFAVQEPAIAEKFPDLIRSAHGENKPRSASIVPTMVNRIQARASGEVLNARYFRTVEDARAWLFDTEA